MLLEAAGWHVCDAAAANILAVRSTPIREFPLRGYGSFDSLFSSDDEGAVAISDMRASLILGRALPQSRTSC